MVSIIVLSVIGSEVSLWHSCGQWDLTRYSEEVSLVAKMERNINCLWQFSCEYMMLQTAAAILQIKQTNKIHEERGQYIKVCRAGRQKEPGLWTISLSLWIILALPYPWTDYVTYESHYYNKPSFVMFSILVGKMF